MSNQNSDIVFADGFFYNEPHENAPDFVLGRVSVKVADALEFLSANANDKGYVNLQILRSQEGKPYMKLDTFVPDSSRAVSTSAPADSDGDGEELPF